MRDASRAMGRFCAALALCCVLWASRPALATDKIWSGTQSFGLTTVSSGDKLTIKQGSVVTLTGDLTIAAGATLVVESNVKIDVGENLGIFIAGTASFLGNNVSAVSDRILLTSSGRWRGLALTEGGNLTLQQVVIKEAKWAIAASGAVTLVVERCRLQNNLFAVWLQDLKGSVRVARSWIADNKPTQPLDEGPQGTFGAVTVYSLLGAEVWFYSNLFSSNDGDGLYVQEASATASDKVFVVNNTFYLNGSIPKPGAGVRVKAYTLTGTLSVRNNLMVLNTLEAVRVEDGGEEYDIADNNGWQNTATANQYSPLAYANLGKFNNTALDPKFYNETDADENFLKLAADSPLIDAGKLDALPTGFDAGDYGGVKRPLYGSFVGLQKTDQRKVDIGAWEYNPFKGAELSGGLGKLGQGATKQFTVEAKGGIAPDAQFVFSPAGISVTKVDWQNPTTVSLTIKVADNAVPQGYTLVATTSEGTYAHQGDAVMVVAKPTVSAPASITIGQGGQRELTITGSGFESLVEATSDVSGVTLSVVQESETQLKLTVTASESAPVSSGTLTLKNNTTLGVVTLPLTVTAKPSVNLLASDALTLRRGEVYALKLVGSGFQTGITVNNVDAALTLSLTEGTASNLTLNATISADAASGERSVTLENPDGGKLTLKLSVTSNPKISAISPQKVKQQNATVEITVDGSDLLAGASWSFVQSGSSTEVPVSTSTRVSDVQWTLTVPATVSLNSGLYALKVSNTDGASATSAVLLTVGDVAPTSDVVTPPDGQGGDASSNGDTTTTTQGGGSSCQLNPGGAPGAPTLLLLLFALVTVVARRRRRV